jgi:hypothetical protein
MARYSAFLGRRVEVQYRAGELLVPASGTFVADSGRSIFLEQDFQQHGRQGHFRWEIPYQCLLHIEEKPDSCGAVDSALPAPSAASPEDPIPAQPGDRPRTAAACAAAAGSRGILPLSHGQETA